MSFWLLLGDYAAWTSMAGIPRIASAPNWPLRTFWIVVWVAMFGIAVYQLFLIFTKFFSFPVTVTTLLQMKPQPFPVVTICNSNPFPSGNVGPGIFPRLTKLIQDHQSMLSSNKYEVSGDDSFGLNKVKTYFKKIERVQEAQVLVVNAMTKKIERGRSAYKYENVVKECSYNDVPCGQTDFKELFDPTYANCFMFNVNSSRKAFRSGMKSGLRLVLNADAISKLGAVQLLPTTQTIGFRVRIAGPNVDPAMESFGIPFGTGAHTKIGLKLTEIRRMKRPYGICVDEDKRGTFYPDNKYSLDVCIRTCLQKRIIKNCGCAHPRYGFPVDQKTCDTDALDCLLHLRENRTFNPLKECECNPSCDELQYDTTISQSRYPSFSQVEYLINKEKIPEFVADHTRGKTFYQKNYALLNVYFDTLNSVLLQEEPAYPILSALIELGGQMVLWLGMSIISAIEMFGLIILTFMYLCCGRKQSVKAAEEELNQDKRIKDVHSLKVEIDQHDQAYKKIKDIGELKWANKPA
ncbi:hypothetical protein L596_027364 [Steinernema carpocapsae]|uniref:Uncharacterized protein n=1 Tax=Steinernema carpocapsae TaxID=34508 RepID=A0A4U5M444_STECR|nr:hypothetical protein L596_027364 [Steinernema carpocapsae]